MIGCKCLKGEKNENDCNGVVLSPFIYVYMVRFIVGGDSININDD